MLCLIFPHVQIGGYLSLSTISPSKGVLIFNFFIVSHVAQICTFRSIEVYLLELFLAQVIVGMSCELVDHLTCCSMSNEEIIFLTAVAYDGCLFYKEMTSFSCLFTKIAYFFP